MTEVLEGSSVLAIRQGGVVHVQMNLKFTKVWSSICIQLLLFHNNQNNVYPHFFLVTLEFLELSCRDNIKRNQEELWTFPPKTPTLYQWTTRNGKMKIIQN